MEEDVIVYETKYWRVLLVPDQTYLGRCVIILKRNCIKLSSLKDEEWADFEKNIVNKLESSLKRTFNATMFNWTCLMNDAYKSKNPKPIIHWNFRPRYNHDVKFGGILFEDKEFAHHYSKERTKIIPLSVLKKISEEIKKHC